ncbi:MAG: methylenetetrahydrofolate reductase [NAD(P)H] [Hydrogenoanaerobacterium sp.]
MKIIDKFGKDKTVYSFEVFPPKKDDNIETIYSTLDGLHGLSPDFISVTYGACGNVADNKTCQIAGIIKEKYNIEPLAHLTCINSEKKDIVEILSQLKAADVSNILSLRGDKIPNLAAKTDFLYASDLTKFILKNGDFSVAGACYPEGHSESESKVADVLNLKKKIESGTSHLISQLFFDNEYFYSFREHCRLANINVPIQAGIMPVVNVKQIERLVSLCGASLPNKFVKIMSRYGTNKEALRDAGIAYAIDQIVDLIANGVDGVHLYTMNNPYVAIKITEAIKNLL